MLLLLVPGVGMGATASATLAEPVKWPLMGLGQ